jgi:hypothetical protein
VVKLEEDEDVCLMVANVFVGGTIREMEDAYIAAESEKKVSNDHLILHEMSVRRPVRGLDDELM